jgi:cysteine desulfurase / selenocysteine lyase
VNRPPAHDPERLIYLDHAATSHPKPPEVIDAVTRFLTEIGGNPGRSGHRLSLEAARTLHGTRVALAELFGVADTRRVLLGAGATWGLNVALQGLLRPGDHVVTTAMEHHAVARPLRWLSERREVTVRVARADGQGRVDPDEIARAIDERTRLVVVNHASNVCGTIQDLAAIRAVTGEVPLLVDAAQTAGLVPIDLARDRFDLLAFSGHKGLLGPMGTGGLALGSRLDPEPLLFGGTGSRSESDAQPDFYPDRHEAGSPNASGLAGLGAGARWVLARGVAWIRAHQRPLMRRLLEGIDALPGLRVQGPPGVEGRTGVISVTAPGRDLGALARRLDQEHGVLTRVGLHCAPLAHRSLGTFPAGTMRLAVGHDTHADDVDAALAALGQVLRA